MEATLLRYRRRIQDLPDEAYRELEGSYLSTFDVYCNIGASGDGHLVTGQGINPCTALVIAEEAAGRGVRILGITSARKRRGVPICNVMPDGQPRDQASIVYVGNYLYFTGHTAVSPHWPLRPQDKVYCPDPPRAAERPG